MNKLIDALSKGGFMMTEPHHIGDGSYRARKLVIGFRDGADADAAMQAVAEALTAYRQATQETPHAT